jgi:hypothetical protein
MFMLYTCQKVGCRNVIGIVEGDDGLFTMVGTPPTKEDFAELGLVIKADIHTKLETASFCGMVFDLEDRRIIADPRKVLATFGWTSRQYQSVRPHKLQKLLRCKALSLAYQYPGCPIIAALSRFGLRVTRGTTGAMTQYLKTRSLSTWQRERMSVLLTANSKAGPPNVEVGRNSRYLVQDLYGIDVMTQIKIEEYLDSIQILTPLNSEHITAIMPQAWREYYDAYSAAVGRIDPLISFPVSQRWPVMAGFRKEW